MTINQQEFECLYGNWNKNHELGTRFFVKCIKKKGKAIPVAGRENP
jgi:hypothetical protein